MSDGKRTGAGRAPESPPADWIRGELLWIRPGRESAGAVYVVRKALGNAVVRNRMKRRLRHLYRECEPVAGSVVILVRPPAVRSSFGTLRLNLAALLARLPGAGMAGPAAP